MQYVVAIHKEPDSCFGVTVPDLPGCFSAGDTLDEAIQQTREAIVFHLEGLAADGDEPPAPRPADEHRRDPDLADADFWALVEVPDHDLPGKAVRLNISMNERVLHRFDAVVKAEGQTRSGLLQRLASEYAASRQSRALERSGVKTRAASRKKRSATRTKTAVEGKSKPRKRTPRA